MLQQFSDFGDKRILDFCLVDDFGHDRILLFVVLFFHKRQTPAVWKHSAAFVHIRDYSILLPLCFLHILPKFYKNQFGGTGIQK